MTATQGATPFLISATVDFPDDCRCLVFTRELLGQLFDQLHWMGVRRLYWNFYQDGFWDAFAATSSATRQTLENLPRPMATACELAHERHMEFFAIIKPYETGTSNASVADGTSGPILECIGGVHTRVDPWVLARPDLRVRVRGADLPRGLESMPVEAMELWQRDMSPIRIQPDDLQIWTSSDNRGFQQSDAPFTVTSEVEVCPGDVMDVLGDAVTRKGESVRILRLEGLQITDPFVAVTTSLRGGEGTFRNTAAAMIRAYGPDRFPLPIVVASHKAVWDRPRDFRAGPIEFDSGHGDINICLDVDNRSIHCSHCSERNFSDCMQGPLHTDSSICRDGVIAFARGRNEYLAGSLSEAYPEVREYWLSWVDECIDAGVDALDVRISNHSCWTNTPELYGFNEPVVREYERRYGVDPNSEPYDEEKLGDLRGELYDTFLRSAKDRLSATGRRLQLHLEVESFRPEAAQARARTRPGNITFHWRQWLNSGLADEATLMAVNWTPERVLNDPVGHEMLRETGAANVPLHLRHFIALSRDGETHADRLEYAVRFGGLSGYNLYEAAAFYDNESLDDDGSLQYHPGLCEALRERIQALGI